MALTVAQDFHRRFVDCQARRVTAGQTSGPYQPDHSARGGFVRLVPVTLACSSGMPAQAQCIFNPSTPQTPGASAVDVVMSISTTAPTANVTSPASHSPIFYPAWLLLPVFVTGWPVSRSPRKRRPLGFGSMAIAVPPAADICSAVVRWRQHRRRRWHLFVNTKRADGTRGLFHNQHRNDVELDGCHCEFRMQRDLRGLPECRSAQPRRRIQPTT